MAFVMQKWFQLLRSEDFMFFFVVHDRKLSTDISFSVMYNKEKSAALTKQNSCRRLLGVWEIPLSYIV